MTYRSLCQAFALVAVAAAFVSISACKPRMLPNSGVPDTRENREILKFMDKYKAAIELHSVPEVMGLVAKDFFDHGGTPEASDDFGYGQLEEKLQKTFAQVKTVNLRFFVQNVQRRNDKIEVVYFFNEHMLVGLPSGEQWMAANDVNRLILRPKGRRPADGYEIVSGL